MTRSWRMATNRSRCMSVNPDFAGEGWMNPWGCLLRSDTKTEDREFAFGALVMGVDPSLECVEGE